MDQLVYIVFWAGLCNRIYTIRDAIGKAEKLNRQLTIVWPNKHGACEIDMDKIFTIYNASFINYPILHFDQNHLGLDLGKNVKIYCKMKDKLNWFDGLKDCEVASSPIDYLENMDGRTIIIFSNCTYPEINSPTKLENDPLYHFKINRNVMKRFQEYRKTLPSNLVGLHYRFYFGQKLGYEFFTNQIKDDVENLYISTDDPSFIIHCKKTLNSNLYYYKKESFKLYSDIDIALIENMILSICNHIIVTPGSTFSTMAKLMNKHNFVKHQLENI